MGTQYIKDLEIDIIRHFLQSISDFIGRKVSVEEMNQAKNGYI